MEITKTVIEKYNILDEFVKQDGYERNAIAKFEDGKFSCCDFLANENPYSYNDWMFLGRIAEKIRKIQERKCEENQRDLEKNALTKSNEDLDKFVNEQYPEKKMTFDDVIWPRALKEHPGLGIAVESLTPESLQKALNDLALKIHNGGTK